MPTAARNPYVVVFPVLLQDMYRLPSLTPVLLLDKYVVLAPTRTELGRIIAVLLAVSLPNVACEDTDTAPSKVTPVELYVIDCEPASIAFAANKPRE
jgi:hypothetical protein